MNILIPHTWLLEYLDTNATPTQIQKILSLCGPSVERIYDREGESVYDIEVTTNRVDSFSVQGIAREAAVILSHANIPSKLKTVSVSEKDLKIQQILPLPKIIDQQKLCKRTMAVVLSNVERTATPEWMAKRLRQTEMSVHDAVIDITNYITHELGHPCHAFDYDQIMELGGVINVKIAEKGKKFVTLDGLEYTTVGGEVVYENDEGLIIDLPAIKGTKNTSINESTKNVMFWIENLEAKKVRFASMTHAIRTTAAQISEKNIDPELAHDTFLKGIKLFQELTGATIASKIYDSFPGKKTPTSVSVKLSKIEEYLGIELPVNTIAEILEKLGCQVKLESGKVTRKQGTTQASMLVTPPSFRPDIQIPADVIEEIARIYGYHNLPSILMPTAIPLEKPTDTNFVMENRIKRFLSALGWYEILNYSMVSESIAKQSGFPIEDHLKIQNPLTDDRVYMRRSLIPSLEEAMAANPQQKSLSLFELANVYHPKKANLPDENMHLSMVSNREYREVKGDLETLLKSFFVKELKFTPREKHLGIFLQAANIEAESREKVKLPIGEIGILPNGHTAIDILLPQLIQVVHSHPTYKPLAKTNEIIEDLTFTLPDKTEIGKLINDVMSISTLVIVSGSGDPYGNNHTITLKYHDPEKNLTVEEVAPVRKKVVELVEKKFKGKLVGKIA